MADDRAQRQEDIRSPSATPGSPSAPVARLLANPRRIRRA